MGDQDGDIGVYQVLVARAGASRALPLERSALQPGGTVAPEAGTS